jgi:hypothetical protein
MHILITVILVALISGLGAGFAFGCRLPELDGPDTR